MRITLSRLLLVTCLSAASPAANGAMVRYNLVPIPTQFGGLPEPAAIANGVVLVNETTTNGYAPYLFDVASRSVSLIATGQHDFVYGRGLALDKVVGEFGSMSNRLPGRLWTDLPPTQIGAQGAVPEGTDGFTDVGWRFDELDGPRAVRFDSWSRDQLNVPSRLYAVDGSLMAGRVGSHPARILLDGSAVVSDEIPQGEFRDVVGEVFVGHGQGPLGWTWGIVALGLEDQAFFLPTLPEGHGIYAGVLGTNGYEAVGVAAGQFRNVAVRWSLTEAGFPIENLNDLLIQPNPSFPVLVTSAIDVDENGIILVAYNDYSGRPGAAILMPVDVPETSGLGLLGAGGGISLAAWWRRRWRAGRTKK